MCLIIDSDLNDWFCFQSFALGTCYKITEFELAFSGVNLPDPVLDPFEFHLIVRDVNGDFYGVVEVNFVYEYKLLDNPGDVFSLGTKTFDPVSTTVYI